MRQRVGVLVGLSGLMIVGALTGCSSSAGPSPAVENDNVLEVSTPAPDADDALPQPPEYYPDWAGDTDVTPAPMPVSGSGTLTPGEPGSGSGTLTPVEPGTSGTDMPVEPGSGTLPVTEPGEYPPAP